MGEHLYRIADTFLTNHPAFDLATWSDGQMLALVLVLVGFMLGVITMVLGGSATETETRL